MKLKSKRILSLVLALLILLSITPTEKAQAGTGGKTRAEAVAWILQQEGKSLDYDGYYGAQCVDLISYYYVFLGQKPSWGNAIDFAWNTLPNGWSRVYSDPQPGDIAVYKANYGAPTYTGQYGHIALVYAISNGRPLTMDQNVGTNGSGGPGKKCDWGTAPVACYIRPDFSGGPVGHLDVVSDNQNGGIYVKGWSYDPFNKAGQLSMHVYIGGEGHDLGPSPVYRGDVNAVHGLTGNHGHDTNVYTNKRGNQLVQIYAIGYNNINTLIYSGTVNITARSPVSYMDNVSSSDGHLNIRGWTFDPDVPGNSIDVHVYIGGDAGQGGAEFHNMGATPLWRGDVNSVHGITGNHGFDWSIKTNKVGLQPVHIYAINQGPGSNIKFWSGEVNIQSKSTITTAYYRIIPKNATWKYVEIPGGSKTPGDQLQLWDKHNGHSAIWMIKDMGDGTFFISNYESKQGLDTDEGKNPWAAVQWVAAENWIGQRWRLHRQADGAYMIESAKLPGNFLDVSGGATHNGAKLGLWTWNGSAAQQFYLERV